VEYYSNKNNTGLELLDIKINGYIDANQINNPNAITYAKGIQFVGSNYGSINFNEYTRFEHAPLSVLFGQQQTTYSYVESNVKAYYYDTQNGISTASAENLSSKDAFKISINDELYFMKLLGEEQQNGKVTNVAWMSNISKTDYDEQYFSKIILDMCRTNSIGLDTRCLLTKSLGDCFAYKKYNDGIISDKWLTSYDLKDDNIIINFTNNVTIQITTHSNGATKSSDSMFGIIEGKNDFEFIQDGIANDYFNGTQTIMLNEYNFDYINTVGNRYTLIFNDKTIKYLTENKDKKIDVIIDLDVLNENNIEIENFDASIKAYKDKINFIKLKQIDANTGEIYYTGVTL
ncbi:MAG: hypothetical protein ACI4TT_04155, partial [Christensenellales bacterium]